DQAANFWWGAGSNGKSVLHLLWVHALGSTADGYAHTPPPELLLDDGRNRHPTEKVGLRGARLVVRSETGEGGHVDGQTHKAVTAATNEYRKAEDLIGQFFDARVRPDPDDRVASGELYAEFKAWWTDEGHKENRTPSVTRFGEEAKRRFEWFKDSKVYYRVSV